MRDSTQLITSPCDGSASPHHSHQHRSPISSATNAISPARRSPKYAPFSMGKTHLHMGDEKIFSPHSTAVSPCCVYQELTPNFPYIPLSQLLVHSYHGTEALKSVKSGVNGENRWAKGALPSSQLRNKYGLIYVGSGLMLRGTQPTFQPAENPAVTPQAGSLVPVCCGSSSPLC